MRVLLCHNRYQKAGGEDSAYEAQHRLLEEHGYEVVCYERSNEEQHGRAPVAMAASALWSARTWRDVRDLIRKHRPHLLHCHNTVSVLSPSIYWAARSLRVPVVQTLHNYRFVCANALLFRNGVPCELCLGRTLPWPGVRYACYRGSRAATSTLILSQIIHGMLRTQAVCIDRYVVLSEFARNRFVEGGLPPERLCVIPNFCDAGDSASHGRGEYALYLGRLTPEKGLAVLMDAFSRLPDVPLVIAGDGPMATEVQAFASRMPSVTYLGWQSRAHVRELISRARFITIPSLWYEGFPMTVVEAFSQGLPVIASRLGGLGSIVRNGVTGFLFSAGNPDAMAATVQRAWNIDVGAHASMSSACRREHSELYSPTAHARFLSSLYEEVVRNYAKASAREVGNE